VTSNLVLARLSSRRPITPKRVFGIALVMLSVTSASYSLVLSLVNPALETLRSTLHTNQLGVSWVLTAYLLSSAVLTPVLGKLGDQQGKKGLLLVTLGLLVVGSIVAASTSDLPVVIVGRVLQGAGGAVLPLAFGLIRDLVPGHRMGSAVGIVAAMSSVGGGLGVLLAGPIVDGPGVRWLFWFPAIANGAIALLLVKTIPRDGHRSRAGVNWRAALLLSAALVCLLVPLSLGPESGWLTASTLLLLVGAVVFSIAWVWVESRAETPLIDMTVFRLKPVWTANLASLMFGVVLYSAMGYIPSFLQVPTRTGYGLGASVTVSGLLFVPITIVMLITGLAAGPLTRLLKPKTVLILGAIPPVVSFVLLALMHARAWEVAIATAIGGLGFGVALSALSAVVVHAVPANQTSAAASMNANIRTVGGAVGAAVVSSILGSHLGRFGVPTESGYRLVFLTLAAAGLLSLIVCLLIPAPATGDVPPEAPPDEHVAELLDQHNPF
jgi:MFS family permease